MIDTLIAIWTGFADELTYAAPTLSMRSSANVTSLLLLCWETIDELNALAHLGEDGGMNGFQMAHYAHSLNVRAQEVEQAIFFYRTTFD